MLSKVSFAIYTLCLTFVVSFTPPNTIIRQQRYSHNSVFTSFTPSHSHFLDENNSLYVKKLRNISRKMNHHSDGGKAMSQKMSILQTIGYTLGSTTSTVVSLTFFSVLAYKRDAFMLTFFIGSLINGIISKLLKRLINQDRPTSMVQDRHTKVPLKPSDKGMPSSHAMSLGFIGTFTILSILLDENITTMFHVFRKWSSVLLLVSYCVISLWFRVATQLHTPEQIMVGLSLGTTNAVVWRMIGFTHGFTFTFNKNQVMTVQDWVSRNIIPSHGYLPIQFMIIPAFVGVIVVGSFERRISSWLEKSKRKDK